MVNTISFLTVYDLLTLIKLFRGVVALLVDIRQTFDDLWCLQFLPIHIWRSITESVKLCLTIHHHHPTRPPNHHPHEKVTSLPPKFSLDQEECKRNVWCHCGLLRQSRNVRVNRSLHIVLDSTKIQKWSWPVTRPLQKKLKKPNKESVKCSNWMALKSQSKLTKRSSTFFMWPSTSQTGATSHLWSLITNCRNVHQQSNQPPALLKNIPLNINKRLTSISSSKEVFDRSIAPYQKALTESGYDHIQPPTRSSCEKQKEMNKKHHTLQPSFQLKHQN